MKTNQRQSDCAYEQLKKMIVHMEIKPGSLVNETDLMERLGFGRTPLREAILRLVEEKLIEIVPRRGYFIADVSVTDITHAQEFRRYLECTSARLAAVRVTEQNDKDFDDFIEYAEQGMNTDDFIWHIETDREFHRLVAAASGNPYLQESIDQMYNLTIRQYYLSRTPMTLVRSEIEIYKFVIDAIKRHDSDEAELGMRTHLRFPRESDISQNIKPIRNPIHPQSL